LSGYEMAAALKKRGGRFLNFTISIPVRSAP
jgi:hypothetical protein